MLKTMKAVALGLGFFGAPVVANAAVIDFDGVPTSSVGSVPEMVLVEDGFTFGLTFTSPNAVGPAFFDTTCSGSACNGDGDLRPMTQGENGVAGNVLILQETGSNVPDDAATGGTITFTLLAGSSFIWEGASAVDDGIFGFSTVSDGNLGNIILTGERETGITSFFSSKINVGDSFTVSYSGSGGIDSLVLTAVPVPAALPLMFGAIGGLAFVSRRRKTKQA